MPEIRDVSARRKYLRISQIELARLTGVSRYRLSMYECGHINLTPLEIDHVSKTLDAVEEIRDKYEKMKKDAGGVK